MDVVAAHEIARYLVEGRKKERRRGGILTEAMKLSTDLALSTACLSVCLPPPSCMQVLLLLLLLLLLPFCTIHIMWYWIVVRCFLYRPDGRLSRLSLMMMMVLQPIDGRTVEQQKGGRERKRDVSFPLLDRIASLASNSLSYIVQVFP